MARQIKEKELVNTRLAANYGGWMYCDACDENIGYVCYSTYDYLKLEYKCQCGSKGSVFIDFGDSIKGIFCNDQLIKVKNRWCCPADNEPLITILDQKLHDYKMEITCKACGRIYKQEKQ